MSSFSKRPRIFRVRIQLVMTQPAMLHAHHAAIIYSLLAQANAAGCNTQPCMPEGLFLEAPEQARLWIAKGAPYAFGFSLLAANGRDAARIVDQLTQGLRTVGRQRGAARVVLGGNFEVELVGDLVRGESHRLGEMLEPIPLLHIDREVEQISSTQSLTLRFLSPLRAHRSKKMRRDGHQFFDREVFDTRALIQRLYARLGNLGFPLTAKLGQLSSAPTVTSNRLVWLDLSYGPRHLRKALGGAMGRVTLGQLSPEDVRCLVWGQYVRVGEATRFGFGNYRIEELGPQPFACWRAVDLLNLVAAAAPINETAEKWELTSSEAREALQQLAAGKYEPRPHVRLSIPKPDGGQRMLSIPSQLDRTLQRGVLKLIAPAVELFLNESSLAYRRGLTRHTAARQLKDAFANGYRWSLRADFLDFFDSLDHSLLRERLTAYLGDDHLTEAVMRWVQSGSPQSSCGMPSGTPLSPLLPILFLDELDQATNRLDRKLARSADDFLILFRDATEADRVLAEARASAQFLQVELNRDKTRTLELGSSFEFLGCRFESLERWELSDLEGRCSVEQPGERNRGRGAHWSEPTRGLRGKTRAMAWPQHKCATAMHK